jgi:hypothetical protein
MAGPKLVDIWLEKNHLYFWINCEHKNPGNETGFICHCQHWA